MNKRKGRDHMISFGVSINSKPENLSINIVKWQQKKYHKVIEEDWNGIRWFFKRNW
jgi:hypothetical protein